MLTIFFPSEYISRRDRAFAPRGRAPRGIFAEENFHGDGRASFSSTDGDDGDENGACVSSSLFARRSNSNASPRYVSNFQYLFSTYLPLSLSHSSQSPNVRDVASPDDVARTRIRLSSFRRTRLKGPSTTLARRSRTISPIPMYDPR